MTVDLLKHEISCYTAKLCFMFLFFSFFLSSDTQEKLDLLLDGAAGVLAALCQGTGGQRQLGVYQMDEVQLLYDFLTAKNIWSSSVIIVGPATMQAHSLSCEHFHIMWKPVLQPPKAQSQNSAAILRARLTISALYPVDFRLLASFCLFVLNL